MAASAPTTDTYSQSQTIYVSNYNEEAYLSTILPSGYHEAMIQAAKQGFLYSFISSIPVEIFTDYFKQRNLTADQIHMATQVIKSVTILALSAYFGFLDTKTLCLILGAPLSSFVLNKYFGMNATASQLLPTAVIVTTEILKDFSNSAKTLLTFFTAFGSSWVGQRTEQMAYQLTKNSLFYMKDKINNVIVNNQRELTYRLSN